MPRLHQKIACVWLALLIFRVQANPHEILVDFPGHLVDDYRLATAGGDLRADNDDWPSGNHQVDVAATPSAGDSPLPERNRMMSDESVEINHDVAEMNSPIANEKSVDEDQCDEDECAICMENYRTKHRKFLWWRLPIRNNPQVFMPSCAHHFHQQCIKRWLRVNANCPHCRAPVKPPSFQEWMAANRGVIMGWKIRLDLIQDDLHVLQWQPERRVESLDALIRQASTARRYVEAIFGFLNSAEWDFSPQKFQQRYERCSDVRGFKRAMYALKMAELGYVRAMNFFDNYAQLLRDIRLKVVSTSDPKKQRSVFKSFAGTLFHCEIELTEVRINARMLLDDCAAAIGGFERRVVNNLLGRRSLSDSSSSE